MRPPAWAVVSAAAALFVLVGGWVAAEAVQTSAYDPVRMTISTLARHGADQRWIMTSALYVIGVCHLVTAAGSRGLRRPARVLLVLAGGAGIGLAVCAQPPHGSTPAHLAFATLGLVVLGVFPAVAFQRGATVFPLRRRDAVWGGLLSLLLVCWLGQAISGTTLGLAERAVTFQQTLWPLLVVIALRRGPHRATGPEVETAPERMTA